MADPTTTTRPAPATPTPEFPALEVDGRFAIVPEWVLDAAISDCALRLYAVLLRYGQSSGARMPGRSTLAHRLHKHSTDTVDRALKELVALGAVTVEHRRDGAHQLTNRYLVRTSRTGGTRRRDAATATPPGRIAAAGPTATAVPGRTDAAGPAAAASPDPADHPAGGRGGAAPPAARMRPDPESSTQSSTPSRPSPAQGRREVEDANRRLLAACGIADLEAFVAEVQRLRRELGQPSIRWAGPCLLPALQLAVTVRGWPAGKARHALLLVATDPRTRSPMRLAEAGPWWDAAERQTLQRTAQEQTELDGLERLLADCDDRAHLQAEARRQLAHDGQPVTRLSVARRAARLLERLTREQPPGTAPERSPQVRPARQPDRQSA